MKGELVREVDEFMWTRTRREQEKYCRKSGYSLVKGDIKIMWRFAAEKLRPDKPVSGGINNFLFLFPTYIYTLMCDCLDRALYNVRQEKRRQLEVQLEVTKEDRLKAGEDLQKVEVDIEVALNTFDKKHEEIWRAIREQFQDWHTKAEQEKNKRLDEYSADHASRGGRQM